jgi:hypothetical protein
MPVRRRVDKRREAVTDEHEAWLHGDDKRSGCLRYSPHDDLTALWANHSERIVAAHVADHPGTRPTRWWQYEAVEPRRRLGGIGTPASDVLAYVPTFSFGLPSIWISRWQVKYYSGIAVDVHGRPTGDRIPTNSFKGVAIDSNNPPTFESQAAYLTRHNLMLAGEERRLKTVDWADEVITE